MAGQKAYEKKKLGQLQGSNHGISTHFKYERFDEKEAMDLRVATQ